VDQIPLLLLLLRLRLRAARRVASCLLYGVILYVLVTVHVQYMHTHIYVLHWTMYGSTYLPT